MAARTVWTAIFRFEIRYQLRQPLFYLVTFALSVLLFIAGTDHAPGGASGRLHLNAPAVILEQLVKWVYLVLFLLTAFVKAWGLFNHADTSFNLGPLRPVLADNHYHRIHHSMAPEHYGSNFAGMFSLWDRVFGTQG